MAEVRWSSIVQIKEDFQNFDLLIT